MLRFNTTSQRSQNMRAIKSNSNATTELRLRGHLMRSQIVGWKVRTEAVLGCPDFFFPAQRVAVFVDGCFWHGCPKCGHTPKTNRPYWRKKLARNKQRDAQIKRTLRSDGIRVLRLWECQLRDKPSSCLKRLFILLGRSPATRN
ncbi:MAG: very short patch repair endonuclease [Candidatus Sulfotelmatobacter sp.]